MEENVEYPILVDNHVTTPLFYDCLRNATPFFLSSGISSNAVRCFSPLPLDTPPIILFSTPRPLSKLRHLPNTPVLFDANYDRPPPPPPKFQIRNRKSSLSAVIDKLKSAQHCDNGTDLSGKTNANRERTTAQLNSKGADGGKTATKVGEAKNSEYMVKPGSDGMKITINKTRTKESAKSSGSVKVQSSSSSGSPKSHTGLKPGVNSGPASKKPQQVVPRSSSSLGISGLSSGTAGRLLLFLIQSHFFWFNDMAVHKLMSVRIISFLP